MKEIPNEIKEKIIGKIYGIATSREDKRISVKQFKFIIGSYRIDTKIWFKLAKELQKEKIICNGRQYCRGFIVNLPNRQESVKHYNQDEKKSIELSLS